MTQVTIISLFQILVQYGLYNSKIGLTLVYVAIATTVHAAIALAGARLRPLFVTERARRLLGAGAAVLLVGIAVWVAVTTRQLG